MLRVKRPLEAPSYLRSIQVEAERHKILNYLRHDADTRSQRRDYLNEDLFFGRELRSELSYVFRDKCAFCETPLDGHGNVHHLRPLRFAQKRARGTRDYYLWLAFEWRNLFYACDMCNKSKGDHFPLEGEPGDFLATYDALVKAEKPLLIDPTSEDPAKHLRFTARGWVEPITQKGEVTVETFRLNHETHISRRSAHLEKFLLEFDLNPDVDIGNMLKPSEPYAGVVRGIFRSIVALWMPGGESISGSGDALIKRFLNARSIASPDDRIRLSALVRDVRMGRWDHSATSYIKSQPLRFIPSPVATRYESSDMSRITLSNFKAIKHLHIDLPSRRSAKAGAPALMILGENSTGKSSILAGIALAAIGTKEAYKLKKYLPGLTHSTSTNRFDQLDQTEVKVDIDFHLGKPSAAFRYDPRSPHPFGSEEPTLMVLGYGARRFFDPQKRNRRDGAATRVQTLFDPLATIPYPEDWLRRQTGNRFDTIVAALRIILALDEEDELIVTPDYLAVRANGRVTPIDSLSEGYKSVFVMTVDIIRELLDRWDNLEQAEALVLIDELETHLHPRWKMQVMTSLRKVFPRVQFIVTTHDPLCLRGMDDGEVMVLQRDHAGYIHALEGLPSVKGMTAEQLLTSDYFGLASTTDASTEIAFATLAGDVARMSPEGDLKLAPSANTTELVSHLAIGDSPTEQIVQDALVQYLERREIQRGALRPQLRAEAVEAVIKALTRDEN
jgi:predicted ATPase/5-methylcytosine-specific restriction endonuclease McrA